MVVLFAPRKFIFPKSKTALDELFHNHEWQSLVPDAIPDINVEDLQIDSVVRKLTGPLSPLAKKHGGQITEETFLPLLQEVRLLEHVLNLHDLSEEERTAVSTKARKSPASTHFNATESATKDSTPLYAISEEPTYVNKQHLDQAYSTLHERLESRVFGQTAAIRLFSDTLSMMLRRPLRDNSIRGNFLIFGPNGCGKSEMMTVLEEWIRDFRASLPVKRLLYCEGYLASALPSLRKRIRESNTPGILVLNEFEKYNPAMRDVLMEGFSRGELVLPDKDYGAKLEPTPVKGWVIILIGNIGRKFWYRLPFKEKLMLPDADRIREELEEESVLNQHYKDFPAGSLSRSLLDRIESFVAFCQLRYADAGLVLDRHIDILQHELEAHDVHLEVEDRVKELLIIHSHYKRGWSARQTIRVFSENIERVARKLAEGDNCKELQFKCADKQFNRIMNKSRPRVLVIDDEHDSVVTLVGDSMGDEIEVVGATDIRAGLDLADDGW